MALARRLRNGPRLVPVRLRADVDLGVSGSRAPVTATDKVASEGLERGCSVERRRTRSSGSQSVMRRQVHGYSGLRRRGRFAGRGESAPAWKARSKAHTSCVWKGVNGSLVRRCKPEARDRRSRRVLVTISWLQRLVRGVSLERGFGRRTASARWQPTP